MGRKNKQKRIKKNNSNNILLSTLMSASTSTASKVSSGDAEGNNVIATTGGHSNTVRETATNMLTGLVLRTSIGVTVVGVSVGAYGLLSGTYTMDNSIQLLQNTVSSVITSLIGSSSSSSLSSRGIRCGSTISCNRMPSSTLLISSTLMSGAAAIVLGLYSNFTTQEHTSSSTASSSKGTTAIICYHGSTADNFADGSNYQKVIIEWYAFLKATGKENCTIDVSEFFGKYEQFFRKEPAFIKHTFASGTNMLLNDYVSDVDQYNTMIQKLRAVLGLGLILKYHSSSVVDRAIRNKNLLDTATERGIIKVLARETISSSCHCMERYNSQAKKMEKLGRCHGCYHEVPKKTLRRCSHCLDAPYCSKKCMKKDWPDHKKFCTPYIKSEE